MECGRVTIAIRLAVGGVPRRANVGTAYACTRRNPAEFAIHGDGIGVGHSVVTLLARRTRVLAPRGSKSCGNSRWKCTRGW